MVTRQLMTNTSSAKMHSWLSSVKYTANTKYRVYHVAAQRFRNFSSSVRWKMSHERAYSEFHALSNHKSKIQIYLINGNIVGKWTYLSEITLFQLPVNKAMGYKGSFTHVFFPYIHFPICCRPADRTNAHIWSVGYLWSKMSNNLL